MAIAAFRLEPGKIDCTQLQQGFWSDRAVRETGVLADWLGDRRDYR